MSDRVEEHETPSVYEQNDYASFVKEDDDDELSDEECMTPQDADDEDERSQAQDSGRQNAERFPARAPQTPTEAVGRKKTPIKSPVKPVVLGKTSLATRVPNPNTYGTSSQNAPSSSSKDKKSNGGK